MGRTYEKDGDAQVEDRWILPTERLVGELCSV